MNNQDLLFGILDLICNHRLGEKQFFYHLTQSKGDDSETKDAAYDIKGRKRIFKKIHMNDMQRQPDRNKNSTKLKINK